MKKVSRITILLLAVLISAFSLCSCQELDEMKEERAVYNADRTEITYKGEVYRLIDAGNFDYIDKFNNNWDSKYVCDADVPVLLASSHGDYMCVNDDKTMLRVNADSEKMPPIAEKNVNPDLPSSYTYRNYYYARSDLYEGIKDTVKNAKLDHYYFEYWDYDYDDMLAFGEEDAGYSGGYVNTLLSEDATAVVNKSLSAADKDKVEYSILDGGEKIWTLTLNVCDKNMLITQPNVTYLLVENKDQYYFWDGNYYNTRSIVPLDKKDTEVIKALFEKYPESVQENNFLWQFTDLNTPVPIEEKMPEI